MQGKLLISLFLLLFAFTIVSAQSEEALNNAPPIGNSVSENYGQNQQTGSSGCRDASPMMQSDFSGALKTVKKLGSDEIKLSTAEQIAVNNCLTTGQIAEFCKFFGFEETKLNFAKFAYDHCTEPQNYFKLNIVLGFSSSVDELNKFVESKQ